MFKRCATFLSIWSCISEISNIKLIIWSLTAMFWHLDGYYLKTGLLILQNHDITDHRQRLSRFFKHHFSLCLIFEAGQMCIHLQFRSIILLLDKYLCNIIHWYCAYDSIYHKYIYLVIILSSFWRRKMYFHWLVTEYYNHYCTAKKKNQRRGNAGLMLIKLMERTLYSTQKSISQLVNVSSF